MKLSKILLRAQQLFLASAALWWLVSCTATNNVTYFQDAAALNGMAVQDEQTIRLRPEDKINIIVSSSNPMLEQQFTLKANTSGSVVGSESSIKSTKGGSSGGGQQLLAYTIDEQGTINFPVLGKIMVGGKTRKQVAEYIQDRLIARELVSDPIVTVEYVNMSVKVMGEVNRAGRVDIDKDHFTILDALAKAGDLTITGQRKDVLVTRQVDGVNQVYHVDLTNMQTLLNSPAYYLQQDDLVYVSPNDKRKREANATGNTFNTPAVWISIASLLATITALIVK